jgi:GTP-binding protein
VLNEVFDLFAALGADDRQLDFPVLYASAKQGWAAGEPDGARDTMAPLFELVIAHVPAPAVDAGAPLRMLASTLEANPYLGRVLTGRVQSGSIRPNMAVKVLDRHGALVEQGRISRVLAFRGLERRPIEEGAAGDIVAVAGLERATVADTICDPAVLMPLPAQPIDPPTLAMTFSVNDSPLGGTEGDKVTSRVIRDRLLREAEGNVALRVREGEGIDGVEVAGRGELQLAILIETMRREGFEMSISRPRVVTSRDEETGERLEPVEEVQVDVDEEHAGIVVDKMSQRRADLLEMRPSGGGKLRLTFHAPTRGLIGYHGEFMTDTRGTGVLTRLFHGYAPWRGAVAARHTGVLISHGDGVAVAYALWNLEDRGPMMIVPGTRVYRGMIVGEHTRGNDLEVNVLRNKQLTNFRAAGKDEAVRLTPPMPMTLERAIAYIADDELVEVTPASIRLRKRVLDPNDRKKLQRRAETV